MEYMIITSILADCVGLLVMSVYSLITLSDLECDYLNAASCCAKLNKTVIPEIMAHCLMIALLALGSNWFLIFLNTPCFVFIIYRLIKIPKGNIGLYDPTEINNRKQLQKYMRDAMVKLVYHVIYFFISMYRLISLAPSEAKIT